MISSIATATHIANLSRGPAIYQASESTHLFRVERLIEIQLRQGTWWHGMATEHAAQHMTIRRTGTEKTKKKQATADERGRQKNWTGACVKKKKKSTADKEGTAKVSAPTDPPNDCGQASSQKLRNHRPTVGEHLLRNSQHRRSPTRKQRMNFVDDNPQSAHRAAGTLRSGSGACGTRSEDRTPRATETTYLLSHNTTRPANIYQPIFIFRNDEDRRQKDTTTRALHVPWAPASP